MSPSSFELAVEHRSTARFAVERGRCGHSGEGAATSQVGGLVLMEHSSVVEHMLAARFGGRVRGVCGRCSDNCRR